MVNHAAEHRLIRKNDMETFVDDLRTHHLRTDGGLEAAGSVIMAPAVAITKFPNAVVGTLSGTTSPELREGFGMYTGRDIRSLGQNTVSAIGNLLTLHPLRAAGNVVKGAFDAVDIAVVDPLLDVGSALVGHQTKP